MTLRTTLSTLDGKRRYVRELFTTIADRYDFITAFLSYGQDRRWKVRLAELAGVGPGMRAVDLACGTGDIGFALARRGADVVGIDVTFRMLQLARRRIARRVDPPIATVTGDMARLPLANGVADVVSTGYGLRNVPDLVGALGEMHRVLRPGGRLVALDFNRPESPLLRSAYLAYLTIVGGALGWVLHRDPDTYRYIPESIRAYPGAHGVARLMSAVGFIDVRVVPLLGGLMAIHVATRGPV